MNYKLKHLLCCVLALATLLSYAQQSASDSLLQLLQTDKEDTCKAIHLNALSSEYRFKGHYDSALICGNTALETGQKILTQSKQPEEIKVISICIAASLNNIGIVKKEQGDYNDALDYFLKSKTAYENVRDKKGISAVLGNLGTVYRNQGNYSEALGCFHNALKICEELNDSSGMSDNFLRIGIVYENQGDYPKALNNYFDALKKYEELNNKQRIALALGNIGIVYSNQSDFKKALEYYSRALKMDEELGNKYGVSRHLGNMGIVYEEQTARYYQLGNTAEAGKCTSKALDLYFKALTLANELGSKQMQISTLGNIGNVYKDQGENEKDSKKKDEFFKNAIEYFQRALKISEEIGEKKSISINLGSIGFINLRQKKLDEAEKNLNAALFLSDSIGALNFKKVHLQFLSELYSKKGDFKKALEYYKKFSEAKDTLFNQDKEKDITRKEMNFEFEKKEATTQAEHNKETAVAEAESRKQKIIIGLMLLLTLAAGATAVYILRSLKITRKQKAVIEKQKEIVDEQRKMVVERNKEISEKNKELTDSINYAQRIQSAILTSEQYLNDMFLPQGQTSSHFILYKPKDIVAGDFYWAYKTPGGKAIWVAADCTGHGVPGAFMSMIGNSLLNEIVLEKGIEEPDEILNQLRAGVIKALGQSAGKSGGEEMKMKDGMDAALCCWDKTTNKLSFAGANNCLWIVRKEVISSQYSVFGKKESINDTSNTEYPSPNTEYRIPNTFIEITADSQPVGLHIVMNPFTKREIQLHPGDTIYSFTDGYCDQFGGPKGKKYKYKPFKELLVSIQDKSMPEQKEIINITMEEWKGDIEQVDDICVFGVRV